MTVSTQRCQGHGSAIELNTPQCQEIAPTGICSRETELALVAGPIIVLLQPI